MKAKKIVFTTIFMVSFLLNIAVAFFGASWLHLRMRPIMTTPEKMRDAIKELSWNSAGEWRVVKQDQKTIIVEYELPIYDITRYSLSKEEFRLSDELSGKDTPFSLSYDGCDISSRIKGGEGFQCMKFRDLSPPERKLESDWVPAYDDCEVGKALGGDVDAARGCAERYVKDVNARRRWEMISAENGDSVAQYNYAIELFSTSNALARARAAYWLNLSAKQGNRAAADALREISNNPDATFPLPPPSLPSGQ